MILCFSIRFVFCIKFFLIVVRWFLINCEVIFFRRVINVICVLIIYDCVMKGVFCVCLIVVVVGNNSIFDFVEIIF